MSEGTPKRTNATSWLVGAVLLLVLALILQMGLLAFAMYALLGVMVFSRWLAGEWIRSVEISRETNREQVSIGEKVAVTLAIRNTGHWPIAWVLIEDLLPRRALIFRPPNLSLSGRRLSLMMLRRGQTKYLNYQLICNQRGYYQIGPTVVETGDLFGLHRRYKVETEPHFVTVFPSVQPIENYNIASRRPIGEIRMTHQLFEDPTRISGVRRYQAGDPLNRVHWRATARTGVLHSKVYDPSSVAGATIVLDFHVDSHEKRHEPVRSELAITAVASLVNALYELQQQVGLVTNGRDAADRIRTEGWTVPPRSRQAMRDAASMRDRSERLEPITIPTHRGLVTRTRIIDTLARLELTDGLQFASLVLESAARMPRDASVVVVLPRVNDRAAIALGSLVQRGYAVTAILNLHEPMAFADASGPLISQGIRTKHLENEQSIVDLCRDFALARV